MESKKHYHTHTPARQSVRGREKDEKHDPSTPPPPSRMMEEATTPVDKRLNAMTINAAGGAAANAYGASIQQQHDNDDDEARVVRASDGPGTFHDETQTVSSTAHAYATSSLMAVPAPPHKSSSSNKNNNNKTMLASHVDNNTNDDPHCLITRFVETQRIMFETALAELQQGCKQSCWLWFNLPTAPYIVDGVERGSTMNRRYALRSDAQVVAYLCLETTRDGINLRRNYIRILQAIEIQLSIGNTIDNLLGPMDAVKAMSSFRLFERIATLLNDKELYSLCRTVLKLSSTSKRRIQKGKLGRTRSV